MNVATEAAVRALLSEHPNLDTDQIQARVEGQRVLLRGRVRTQRERMEAEATVRQVYGIAEVDNGLVVTGEPI